MSNKTWICIGKVKKAHSLQGELFLFLFAGLADWYPKCKEIALSSSQEPTELIRFQIKKLTPHKDGFIARLEGIQNRNQSEAIEKHFVFIESQQLVTQPGEEPFLFELYDFEVFDFENSIGHVTDFYFNGAQDILVVTSSEYRFEIPYVEAFIKHLDFEAKKIKLELPEGLLETTREKC